MVPDPAGVSGRVLINQVKEMFIIILVICAVAYVVFRRMKKQ